jgi:K+-transporting ATPase KdpF subunit
MDIRFQFMAGDNIHIVFILIALVSFGAAWEWVKVCEHVTREGFDGIYMAGVVSLGIGVYLLYALLRPERF